MSKNESDDAQVLQKLTQDLFQHAMQVVQKYANSPITGLYIAHAANLFSSMLSKPIEMNHPLYSKTIRLILHIIEKYALIANQVQSTEHLKEVQQQVSSLSKQLSKP
jgi:hypothetical protein